MTKHAPHSSRPVIMIVAVALVLMLATVIVARLTSPQLTEHRPPTQQKTQPDSEEDIFGSLMQQVAKNPQDMGALLQLAELLMENHNWEAAKTFAERASMVDVQDARPLFMLGVILHNLGKEEEAAASLEKVISLKDTAPARYSLGILYLYYLNEKDKGIAHLKAGLKDPGLEEDLKRSIEEELKKLQPGTAK